MSRVVPRFDLIVNDVVFQSDLTLRSGTVLCDRMVFLFSSLGFDVAVNLVLRR